MNYRTNEDKRCNNSSDHLEYNNIIAIDITDDVSTEPLSLANAKIHLRVDFSETDNDAYITQLIKETREQIEEEVRLALAPKTIKVRIRNELGYISLPFWTPNAEVVEVTDHTGETIDEDSYTITNGVIETVFNDDIFVEYETGYETIPNKYLRMIKERLAFNYVNRGDEKKENNRGVWLV